MGLRTFRSRFWRDMILALCLAVGVLAGLVQARALGAFLAQGDAAIVAALHCQPEGEPQNSPKSVLPHCGSCLLPGGLAILPSPVGSVERIAMPASLELLRPDGRIDRRNFVAWRPRGPPADA